jgi:hypothetical protein
MIVFYNQSGIVLSVLHEPSSESLSLVKNLLSELYPSAVIREVDYGN